MIQITQTARFIAVHILSAIYPLSCLESHPLAAFDARTKLYSVPGQYLSQFRQSTRGLDRTTVPFCAWQQDCDIYACYLTLRKRLTIGGMYSGLNMLVREGLLRSLSDRYSQQPTDTISRLRPNRLFQHGSCRH